MKVLALDPGPVFTGWAFVDDGKLTDFDKWPNEAVLRLVSVTDATKIDVLCIEMIASYGMAVGQEVFETCVWIGRFMQAWGGRSQRVTRQEVKLHLCKSSKAKDANVRQALIDLLGPPGKPSKPGPTFGVAGDMWSAIAVAVYADRKRERRRVLNGIAVRDGKRLAPDQKPGRRVQVGVVPVARKRVQG